MAKPKNKKKVFSEKIQRKKENQFKPKPINPFEVHLNKEKLKVLGKRSKNDKGIPGISRAKAIKKRKHTLLQEYKIQNKTNKFTDKRIGEWNQDISDADKAMMRFAASRIKAHRKKNIFNLAEDEIITHKGQSLQEIEKFDDPRSDEEEDDEQGRLDKNFVKNVHFGGGIFSDTGKDGATSHKQLIDQLIEESKKRKVEQQRIKEATLELTEKLDTEWKDLIQIVNKSSKEEKETEKPQEKTTVDHYDKMLKELRFEKRGTVSDRLKTENELEQENKEKLEKLEQERLERMQADYAGSNKRPHRSADDLDDDFVYDSDPDVTLSYNQEGKSNLKIDAQLNGHSIEQESTPTQESEEEESSDDDNKDDGSKEEESDNQSDAESEDSLTDLKNDEESSDSEMEVEEKNSDDLVTLTNDKKSSKSLGNEPFEKMIKKDENINIKIAESEKVHEEDIDNLPATVSLPESYDGLMQIFEHRKPKEQSVLLERMIKSNDPSISPGNKEQLGLLFAYLLQYLNDLFSEINEAELLKNAFLTFKLIMPSLYELAKISTINAHNSLIEVIKEKHLEYRNKKSCYPGLEILVFLKLISLLFTTSDFRHQVVTPSFVLIEEMLAKCKIKNGANIAYGLFLCTVYLEYTTLSDRYLPAVINFLSGLVHMAIPKTSVRLIKAPHPFKSLNNQLVLSKDCSKLRINSKIGIEKLITDEIDDKFRITALHATMRIVQEFTEKYKNFSSNVEIFSLIENYLHQVPMDGYPKEIQKVHSKLVENLEVMKSERKLFFVAMEQKRPKALRLYEPKFEEVYDTKQHKGKSKEKAEKDKLLYKFKKERKGALREIRRDKAFLGRVKIKQKIRSDIERRDKVNRIFAEAASQQSELNALDRQKKKK